MRTPWIHRLKTWRFALYPEGFDLSHRLDLFYNHINASKLEYLPDLQETQPMKGCTYGCYQLSNPKSKHRLKNHGFYFEHTFLLLKHRLRAGDYKFKYHESNNYVPGWHHLGSRVYNKESYIKNKIKRTAGHMPRRFLHKLWKSQSHLWGVNTQKEYLSKLIL